MKLGSIYINVRAKTDKYKRDLANAKTMTGKAAVLIQKQISNINFKAVGISAVAFAGVATVAIKKVIDIANEQVAVEKRLEAVLKSTGEAAGFNIEQLKKMASSMQEVTTTGDEVILKNMAILATFKRIRGEGFERATMAALDMSEVMQKELGTSIVMIGKALNDPIANLSAMSKAGVQFTKVQKDMVKELWNAGDAAGAQAIILKELESQFGGAAKVARDNFGGAVDAASNALGDMHEQIGFAIIKNKILIDLVKEAEQQFIKAGDAIGKWVNANDKLIAQKTHETIKKIRDTVVGIVNVYNSLPDGIVGTAGIGILGAVLFGGSVGRVIFTISLINDLLKTTGNSLGDLVDKHYAAGKAIIKLYDSIKDAIGLANDELERITTDPMLFKIGVDTKGYEKYLAGKPKPPPPLPPPLPALEIDYEKELKKRQEANQKKYAIDIELAKRIKDDTWLIRQEGFDAAIKQHKETQTQITQIEYDIRKDFNEQYAELGKTRFDLEREQILQMVEIWREAGIEENRISKMVSDKNIQIAQAEQVAKLDVYQNIAGGIAGTFQAIAQAGGKQSKKAFMVYKAFAMVEAAISGHKAILQALGSAPPPYNFVLAGIAGAAAAIQIGMIAAAQPPSYDQGGISNARGIYQTGDIAEAHIPIPSGGKIPVEVNDKDEKAPTVVNIFNTVDPGVLDVWSASSRGQNAIFNSIGSQPQRLRRLIR